MGVDTVSMNVQEPPPWMGWANSIISVLISLLRRLSALPFMQNQKFMNSEILKNSKFCIGVVTPTQGVLRVKY